jgi:hypothetical protein
MNLVFGNTFGNRCQADAESTVLARLEKPPSLLPPCCRTVVNSVAAVAAT